MTDRLPDADARRTRLQCYLAAAVFAACGVALAFLPFDMPAALRWAAVGFNALLAVGGVLYARQIRGGS